MSDANPSPEKKDTDADERKGFRSIRRSSFVNSYYNIKEEDDDEVSNVSSLDSGSRASKQNADDGDLHNSDVNAIEESNRSYNPFDVDLAKSRPVVQAQASESSFEIDPAILSELEASSSSRRLTVKRSNLSNSQAATQDDDIEPPNTPPARRKGSLERRMLLKAGIGMRAANEKIQRRTLMGKKSSSGPLVDEDEMSFEKSRRNSTGSVVRGKRMSMESLASFSSAASATSGEAVVVGNLTFVTDIEMLSIMYEENDDSDSDSVYKASYSSLPPSAILGKGSTSMVRLAWRKANISDNRRASMDTIETSSDMEEGEAKVIPDLNSMRNLYQPHGKSKSRRSIVRVVSQPMSEGSQASSKGDLVAVKLIQKSVLKQMRTMTKDASNRVTVRTAFDNIEREIAMMKRLQHPNVVRLFEVIDSVESDKLYMVLEYVSLGEILSHVEGTDTYKRMRYKKKVKGLTSGGYFDEKNAALYFVDVMHGVAYLHRHGICHRDLKPENILLGANGIAKISDFGVAHVFDNEKDEAIRESLCLSVNSDYLDESERTETGHKWLSRKESDQASMMPSQHDSGLLNKTEGTWCFWSPEMCNKSITEFSGYACDLWAAGICLFIFTTGKLPFFSMAPLTLFDLISKAEVPYDSYPNISSSLEGILKKMLTKDPADRAGVGFCLQHEFCKDAREQRMKELIKDFEHSDHDIVLTNEEVHTAFSVTKISSMFDTSKKRGHDVDAIKVASVDEKVEEDNAPEAFNPASNKTESKCKGTLKHRLRKFLKHFN